MRPGLIGDLFAGGGGASVGIEAAFERKVDFAINHSETALAVHKANHPKTKHLTVSIWDAKPKVVCRGRHLMFLWASPDCTHFSVAKGGKPRKQNIRSLAHAVVEWARDVRPDVIMLENVQEFVGWGPLDSEGRPIKARMGETFQQWKGRLELLGYVVDHHILDASLYGAPTRRRRLFLIARCDGRAIVWPEPTHGPGKLPVHTAAECIDWGLPCPSIFDRKKPLAEKTLWRIAQGIKKFVLENPTPFIVRYNGDRVGQAPDEPLTTVDTANRFGLVTPVMATIDQQSTKGATTSPEAPLPTTVTKNRHAVIAPHLVKVNHGKREARGESLGAPLSTVTASRRGHAVVMPVLTKFQQNSVGQSPESPLDTVMAGATRFGLIAPTMVQTSYGERPGQRPRYLDLHQPLGTVVAGGQKHALVSAFLAKHYGDPGRTSGGGVVVGSDLGAPIGTVTARDHHSLATATLVKLRGDNNGAAVDEPMPTITASGNHVAEVRAFLVKYFKTGIGQPLDEPMHTVTTKHRLGIVTVHGVEYQIADIGFRMLEPHELLRAQFGRFAESYDLSAAKTKAEKVRLIGNSVCPELVEQLVRANITKAQRRAA
jgi:DNA (cytosine-5)-methyltransferase 1